MSRGEIYRLEDERNTARLCHLLASTQDRKMRETIVLALRRLHDPDAVPYLVEAGLREEHPSVRLALVETLRSFHDRRAVPVFVRFLSDDKQNTRLRAIRGLAETKDPDAVRPLIELLEDSDPHVRVGSAEALAEIGDSAALEPISAALRKMRRPWLRSRLRFAHSTLADRAV